MISQAFSLPARLWSFLGSLVGRNPSSAPSLLHFTILVTYRQSGFRALLTKQEAIGDDGEKLHIEADGGIALYDAPHSEFRQIMAATTPQELPEGVQVAIAQLHESVRRWGNRNQADSRVGILVGRIRSTGTEVTELECDALPVSA